MKLYSMIEPGLNSEPVEVIYTEDDILESYWDYWNEKMIVKYGPFHPLITKDRCIEDWCALHWAWEVK